MHYFESPPCGKGGFAPSETKPNQGFRMKDLIARMTAGSPMPVGRDPVFIDPKYGVDPCARYDVPIEEMAMLADNARTRMEELQRLRDEQLKTPDPWPALTSASTESTSTIS